MSPLRYRSYQKYRRARIALSVAIVICAVLAGVLVIYAVKTSTKSPSSSATSKVSTAHHTSIRKSGQTKSRSAQQVAGSTVPLGVYAGPGSPAGAQVFAADTGSTVPYALDYLDASSWQTIADPSWLVSKWAGSGFQMIWGVPMLPDSGATLAQGATGAYNSMFTQLSEYLVSNGDASAVLMIGWDPEEPDSAWSVSTEAQAHQYVLFWRQIVTSMRAVPGSNFKFAWDVTGGPSDVSPTALFPGKSVVDLIATDVFDQSETGVAANWASIEAAPYGLNWVASYAAAQGKPLMIAKWGLVPSDQQGGGDDPEFVSSFLGWATQKHVFVAVAWDYGSWAISNDSFPRSEAVLHQLAIAGADASLATGVES